MDQVDDYMMQQHQAQLREQEAKAPKCIHCNRPLYMLPGYGWQCKTKGCYLEDLEQDPSDPADIARLTEYRQQQIIDRAVNTADSVIMDGSNGSVEETDYLTSAVALKFTHKAHLAHSSRLLRKENLERHGMEETSASSLLGISLSCAVPLWIERLKTRPWAELEERRTKCLEIIAHHGDNILFRSKKSGDTAEAFNALAEALAILSFVPGGVKAFGLEFKSVHPEGGHNCRE